jgi:outer membrane protein OmpA-like peptidoglycan-associated protein
MSLAIVGPAAAAAPAADASGSAKVSNDTASADGDANTGGKSKRKDRPWIKRWAPERNMVELGVFGGVMLPSRVLELFEADFELPRQGFKPYNRVAPEVGGRVGFYPSRFFGFEAEGAGMFAKVQGDRATLWRVGGHLVGQVGLWNITPFVLIGPGALGVASDRSVVGNDVDLAFHFGGGLKLFLHRYVALRIDARDVVNAQRGVKSGLSHSVEVLGGITFTFGRKDPKPKSGPGDLDGDGFLDPDDKCIDVPGVAPDGCPIPDTDGDGFKDDVDKCIDEPGVEPDGCPIRDTDGDGIMDPDDQCPKEPETRNKYQDADGCPDEVPKEVEKFTGVIQGIFFDTGKATIKPKSKATLDAALDVLKKHPTVRVEISGHTDITGSREFNLELSRRRAEAVEDYLVKNGLEATRIETRGAGPDEPIADNKTKAGRAKNRRIEFKLINE